MPPSPGGRCSCGYGFMQRRAPIGRVWSCRNPDEVLLYNRCQAAAANPRPLEPRSRRLLAIAPDTGTGAAGRPRPVAACWPHDSRPDGGSPGGCGRVVHCGTAGPVIQQHVAASGIGRCRRTARSTRGRPRPRCRTTWPAVGSRSWFPTCAPGRGAAPTGCRRWKQLHPSRSGERIIAVLRNAARTRPRHAVRRLRPADVAGLDARTRRSPASQELGWARRPGRVGHGVGRFRRRPSRGGRVDVPPGRGVRGHRRGHRAATRHVDAPDQARVLLVEVAT
jgi:hypothetical protein